MSAAARLVEFGLFAWVAFNLASVSVALWRSNEMQTFFFGSILFISLLFVLLFITIVAVNDRRRTEKIQCPEGQVYAAYIELCVVGSKPK